MMNTIMGHRGSAGHGLENTETVIRTALKLGVRMFELDVRLTYDKKLILCHDADLERMAGDARKISDHTWADLQDTPLKDGSRLLTLEDALRLIGNAAAMIELKDSGSEYSLLSVLDQFPNAHVSIASYKISQLAVLRELRPSLPVYGLEHTKPIDIVQAARALKLTGIGLNFWLLNPLTYWMARRAKLSIYVYTVNNPFYAWFLQRLYPHIMICTDYPDRLQALYPSPATSKRSQK